MTENLVPSSKSDVAAAELAVARGWPAVEPVLPKLLEWLQDYNWPVARVLAPFVAQIGDPVAPYLRPIFDSDDLIWKRWIINVVLADAPLSVVEQFRSELEHFVNDPTPGEAQEDLPEVAKPVLDRLSLES